MLSDAFFCAWPYASQLLRAGSACRVLWHCKQKTFWFWRSQNAHALGKSMVSDEKLHFFNVLCNVLSFRWLCLNAWLCVWFENAKRGLLYAKSIAFMMQNGTNHGTNSLLSVCKTDDLLAILHQFCERKLMKWDFSRCQINIRLKSVFQITENSVHNYPPCLPCEKAKKSLPSVS